MPESPPLARSRSSRNVGWSRAARTAAVQQRAVPLITPTTGTSFGGAGPAGPATGQEAALLRRGCPLGLASVPSWRERSGRIGCTRMIPMLPEYVFAARAAVS